jgi:hypothetical protein
LAFVLKLVSSLSRSFPLFIFQVARILWCPGYLVHPIKNGTLRSHRSKRKGEWMPNWKESVSWTRDAVLERESAPELVCKVLARERASEKDGTEGVDSAIEGQSPLPSGLRHIKGNEVFERSNPISTHEACWGAS